MSHTNSNKLDVITNSNNIINNRVSLLLPSLALLATGRNVTIVMPTNTNKNNINIIYTHTWENNE